jgi:hypothetical protein
MLAGESFPMESHAVRKLCARVCVCVCVCVEGVGIGVCGLCDVVLQMEPRASHMLANCSTFELHS